MSWCVDKLGKLSTTGKTRKVKGFTPCQVSTATASEDEFPYSNDAKLAGAFLVNFFKGITENVDICKTWIDLKTLFQIHVESPEVFITIDTRNGKDMQVSQGKAKGTPDVTMTLTAKTFHELYSGKVSTFQAFGSGAVKTEGDRSLVTKATRTLPQTIKMYLEYCRELGMPVEAMEEKGAAETTEVAHEAGTSLPRSKRLKSRFLTQPREICVERARYYTESHKATEGEPAVVRQAKALRNILNKLTVRIYPDELIVGNITSKPLGAGVYPETALGPRIEGELNRINKRSTNPFTISEEDKRELQEKIFPYWRGKTIIDLARKYWPKEVTDKFDRLGVFILTEIAGIGHMLINHERVLKFGVKEMINQARKLKQEILEDKKPRSEEIQDNLHFYEAVEIACQSVIDFARRHSKEAKNLAEHEKNPARHAELEEIARVCAKVPENPAATLHECLQAMFFTHVACQIESYESAISLGRMDQYLYPCYQADLKAERIDDEKAQELLELFFLKLSSVIPLFDTDASIAFAGLTAFANVVIGGIDGNGNDATNELSYVILNAARNIKTPQPNFGIRIHEGTPEKLLTEVSRAALEMGTLPHVFNDRLVIKSLTNRGIPLEDARNYGIIGCVEPAVPGKSFTSSDAALFNLGLCLELALNDGKGRVMVGQIGPQTGNPATFKSMEEVMQAYRKQVQHLVERMIEGLDVLARVHAEMKPTVFASSLTDDCLARGKDLTHGGAVYNFTGPQGVGLATVADSLAAIDELVFKERKVSMGDLVQALNKNFVGYEPVRQTLVNYAPKYGTDNDLADDYARQVGEIYCREVENYRNPRGGWYSPGLYSVTMHITFGILTGALPNGRKATKSLSCGVTPEPGTATFGPTALLKSAAKLNYGLVSNGAVLTLKLNPSTFRGESGIDNLKSLIKSHFRLGGMHIQCNFVSREDLIAAQKHPEEHRDLVVRVAGYSALFTDLDRLVQDEIIARTEF